MKRIVVVGLVLAFAGILPGGCASKRTQPVQEGTASLRVIPPVQKVCLDGVQVYQYEDEFVVMGNVHRGFRLPYWFSKHIDVAVLCPDGQRLADMKTQERFSSWPPRSPQTLSFVVRFPGILPKGSTVVVAYHGNTGKINCTDECLENFKQTLGCGG